MNPVFCLAFVITPAVSAQAQHSGNQVSKANNEFAVKLYKHLIKEKENLVCSPISVSTILSVLLQGSPETTETHKELLRGLEYDRFGLKLNNVENGYRKLLESLRSKDDVTLDLANSVWIKERIHVRDDFRKDVKDVFKAEVKELKETNGAEDINKWVADRTNNKIRKLFDGLDDSVLTVLVNAIYFKAPWDKQFDERRNEDGSRFKSNDDVNSADTITLMKQRDNFPYFEDPSINARVLAMNYKGKEMKLAIFLPRDGHKLADLEESLTAEKIDHAINNAELREVNVAIPKFNLTSSLNLEETLKKMGMTKIFRDDAEFTKITRDVAVKVSKVVQKATIDVSEDGAEAAAATGVHMVPTSLVISSERPVEFRADHPFLYVLYHQRTKSTVFMGRFKNASRRME